MGKYHDTVREELEEILFKLQDSYRKVYPGTVLLFSVGQSSLGVNDVARKTAQLAPKQGSGSVSYAAYTHNIPSGNSEVCSVETEARQGLIEVKLVDRANPEKNLAFRMKVGIGGRVMDYEVQGTNGMYRESYTKASVISTLEQAFS